MLRIHKISKAFGRNIILHNVSFSIHSGQVIALFGPNGAGKTTLLKIIAQLMYPSSGELYYNDRIIQEDREAFLKSIGFVTHTDFLYDDLTSEENLLLYCRLYGVPHAAERVATMLHRVDLWNRRTERIRNFSRGMIQRLTLARAFLHKPKLLLFDEPYTGLDVRAVDILNTLISRFISQERAMIMTTHQVGQGFSLATHAMILAKKRIVFQESTDTVSASNFEGQYNEHCGMIH